MTRTSLIWLALLGSAALLAGAFAFQYVGGMAPCTLCIWQRWPHAVAVLIGLLALRVRGPVLPLIGTLALVVTAGLALFHTGVERHWWEGLASCSAGSIAGISAQDLIDPAKAVAPVVRCGDVAWSMAGLSMASWNGILSVLLAGVWLMAARTRD